MRRWKRTAQAITYDKTLHLVCSFDGAIRRFSPESVIGIARGGVVPAVMLAQRHGCALKVMSRPRNAPIVWEHGAVPHDQRVVLVDDLVSSGATMAVCRAFLEAHENRVLTCAVFTDITKVHPRDRPDVDFPTERFIRYPWDALDSTPVTTRRRQAQAVIQPHEERDYLCICLETFPKKPPIFPRSLPGESTCFLTTRLDPDKLREALSAWGYGDSVVVSPRTSFLQDDERRRSFKVRQIEALNVSSYVDADVHDALAIAAACPVIDIFWQGPETTYRLGGISATWRSDPR